MKQISKRTWSQLGATVYSSFFCGIAIWFASRLPHVLSHIVDPVIGPVPTADLLLADYWSPVMCLGLLLAENFDFWKMSDCMPDLGPDHDKSWLWGCIRADFMPFYLYMVCGFSVADLIVNLIPIPGLLLHLLLILFDAVGLLILAHCARPVIAAELPRWKTELRATALGKLLQRHAQKRRLPGETLADYYKRVNQVLTSADAKPEYHTFTK